MQLPKAILFDLDDTIVSFDGVSDLAWEKTCNSFVSAHKPAFDSHALMQKINEVRRWYWGDPIRHKTGRENMIAARRQVVSLALQALGSFNEDVANKMADGYSALQEASLCLLDGAFQALEVIKSLHIRMAIITNGTSEKQRGKIERFHISQFFEFIVIDTEVGFSKPDVRIFEYALEKLALHPKDVWMVGDNLVWDVEAPQKLGIYSIWNDYTKKGLPDGSRIIPDKIVTSILELSQELME